ncbi:hypothetical protein JQ615_39355 [Bradyrhizobium jicamae]|uniref:Uncharacterized protein n=1 Tax=Bradyrhizobium jicamae TaxID=280332 RepID=A0ABS5FXA3_9BRAD|nr:hypothetical protein [Bradyrhizobium jicamae]MBR0801422.1 hypothetical protein [Bradyrhizobium jicamae]
MSQREAERLRRTSRGWRGCVAGEPPLSAQFGLIFVNMAETGQDQSASLLPDWRAQQCYQITIGSPLQGMPRWRSRRFPSLRFSHFKNGRQNLGAFPDVAKAQIALSARKFPA